MWCCLKDSWEEVRLASNAVAPKDPDKHGSAQAPYLDAYQSRDRIDRFGTWIRQRMRGEAKHGVVCEGKGPVTRTCLIWRR